MSPGRTRPCRCSPRLGSLRPHRAEREDGLALPGTHPQPASHNHLNTHRHTASLSGGHKRYRQARQSAHTAFKCESAPTPTPSRCMDTAYSSCQLNGAGTQSHKLHQERTHIQHLCRLLLMRAKVFLCLSHTPPPLRYTHTST